MNGEKLIGTYNVSSGNFSIIKTAVTNRSEEELSETFTITSNGKLIVIVSSFFYSSATLTINDIAKTGTLGQDTVGDQRRLMTFIEDVKVGDNVRVMSAHSNTGNCRGANMTAILAQ